MTWLEEFKIFFNEQPIVGAIALLAAAVFVLWLFKKAIKALLIGLVVLALLILASYFFYDEGKTEKVVRRGASEAAEKIEEGAEYVEEKFQNAAEDAVEKATD